MQCIERHLLGTSPGTVSDSEKKLSSLPARHGWIGNSRSLSTAVSSFTAHIVDEIKSNLVFSVFNHIDHLYHREMM